MGVVLTGLDGADGAARYSALMTERGIVIGTHNQVDYVPMALGSGVPGTPDHRLMGLGQAQVSNRVQNVGPAVRKALLYFDRIEWPAVNIDAWSHPEIDILSQQGFVQRTRIKIPAEIVARSGEVEAVDAAHRWCFEQLAAQADCVWAYAHIVRPLPPEFYWPRPGGAGPDLIARRAVSLELYDMLPIPGPNVPFADILDFRSRDTNANALATLREYMDDLYQDVINSGDVIHAKSTAMNKVDRALAEVSRAMAASRLPAWLTNLSIDVMVIDVAATTVEGAEAAAWVAASPHAGAVVGAAVGVYKFFRRAVKSPLSRAGPLAYYLAAASREQIVQPPATSA